MKVLDPRLAAVTAAVCAGAVIGTQMEVGAPVPVAILCMAGATAGLSAALALRSQHHRPGVVGTCIVVAALGAGLGAGSFAAFRYDNAILTRLLAASPERVVNGTVVVEVAREAVPNRTGGVSFEATVRRFTASRLQPIHLAERVIVLARAELASVEPGDHAVLRVRIRAPPPALAPALRRRHVVAVADVTAVISHEPATAWPYRLANSTRRALRRGASALPGERGPLLTGLLTGDTRGLSPATEDDMRTAGLAHLVAVSGANVAWVLAAGVVLLRLSGVARRARIVVLATAVLGLCLVTGWEPSVLRASMMAAVALSGGWAGRGRITAGDRLCAAVTVLVCIDPFLIRVPALLLSVAATAGLVFLSPRLLARMPPRPRILWVALAATIAAQVAVAPILLATSGRLSLIAPLANLLALPAAAGAVLWGALASLAALLVPPLAGTVHFPDSLALGWILGVARVCARTPFAEVHLAGAAPYLLGASALAGATLVLLARSRRHAIAAVLVSALIPIMGFAVTTAPPGGVRLTVLDVGQGDAMVLEDGTGAAVLVDAGPDADVVLAGLGAIGVTRLDLVVLTHPHLDHFGGLAGVLRRMPVGAVAFGPAQPSPLPEYAELEAEIGRGVQQLVLARGDTFMAGRMAIEVLGPERPARGTRSDANNSSLVLRARVDGVTILLLGDAEIEQQARLLRDYGPAGMRADVLKVAHHGSAFQDAALLAAIEPRVAVVSAGARNRYGHPAPIVIDALTAAGALVRRTDQHGRIEVAISKAGEISVTSERR